MKDIWDKIDKALGFLMHITSGKTIILWGYGKGGWFVEHLFKRNNRIIDCIIDVKSKENNPYYIRKFDPDTSIVILTFLPDEKATDYLQSLGFKENESFFYMSKLIYENPSPQKYLSYLNYLEENYGLNLMRPIETTPTFPTEDGHIYGASVDYSLIDIMDNFCISKTDAIFDFGSGKGAALIMFLRAGFTKVGGVEYDRNLWEISKDNFSKIDVDYSGILCKDARILGDELDIYNYFYMYDPFEGDMFLEVLKRIEESYERSNRMIFLIYAVPNCHEIVLKTGFKLSKYIKSDFFDYRTVNIYRMG